MRDVTKLNSITDNTLGTDLGALGNPEGFLDIPARKPDALPTLATLQEYTSELARLANKLYGKSRTATYDLAWRCKVCNTISGVKSNTTEPRKTCRKCARPRNNELTLKTEMEIRILMENSGLSQEEATERVLSR